MYEAGPQTSCTLKDNHLHDQAVALLCYSSYGGDSRVHDVVDLVMHVAMETTTFVG